MHTFEARDGTRILHNSDLSGEASIISSDGLREKPLDLSALRAFIDLRLAGTSTDIPPIETDGIASEAAIRQFAATKLGDAIISRVEELDTDGLLSLNFSFSAPRAGQ